MRNTDASVIQERIGELCHQFKVSGMDTQSVARFTEAGYGDALSTFLEVRNRNARLGIKGWRPRSDTEPIILSYGLTSGPAESTDETAHAAPRR